ncbi:LexA family protein [Thalassotalea aquiviva]|uniref:LexA family protein n=1 Tax=Thalassotalea aquiviva TaxID=3242415 RepID=UPI00352A70F9
MLKFIPIKAQAGITGFESPAADYQMLGLSLDKLLIEHPSATYIGLANGESMVELGIFDGDLLVIDRSVNASNGDVIVANLNGVFVCKQIDKYNHRLLSSSSTHQAYEIREGDDFQIEGVVVRSIRLHRKLNLDFFV